MPKAKDDDIYVKKNDIDAIRRRPTMYISSLGDAGVFHLCKEIIDNNRDECLKKESPGDTISVSIYDDHIESMDNGRGIPTDLLRIVHETNQAGSNMTRAGGMTAGENGTGTTTYTAMSKKLIVKTLRPTEKKILTLEYHEGELINDYWDLSYSGKESGLYTVFYPSKKVLGTDRIPVDMVVNWLKDFDFTLPRGINMTYTVRGKKTYKVNHKELYEYFDLHIPTTSRLCNALVFTCKGDLKETVLEKVYDRKFDVEVAITYSDPETYKGDDIRQSWMNMIHTSDNGSHMDGVVRGFQKFMTERVGKKNKKLEGTDIKKDILAHLNVVIKAECNFANMFASQAKHRVFSKELGNAIADAVYEALCNSSSSVINEMIEVIIGNHRARIEGEKARSVASSTRGLKSWSKPDSYIPYSSIKTEHPKELFLVEGLSAGGGLRGARDARYQAILSFRGKNLNPWDEDLDRVLKSVPWLNLVNVLGCGIGPTFDIKKLKFDKIIITTDADIDGYHIRVGFLSFFAKFMPEIITSGKLYIAEPPLYQLTAGKKVSYVASQREYIDACVNSIGNIEVEFPMM